MTCEDAVSKGLKSHVVLVSLENGFVSEGLEWGSLRLRHLFSVPEFENSNKCGRVHYDFMYRV